jgi:acetyl esterase/lipase
MAMKRPILAGVVFAFLLVACGGASGAPTDRTPAPTVLPPEASPPSTELPELGAFDSAVDAETNVARDVPYMPDGLAFQELDVYLPAIGEGPFPTILAIHGGGFRARSKSIYRKHGTYFTESGYAFVATNYRLTSNASYPAQVEDVFCALAWVHANHETYGFDTEHVFVMGGSAGGYLAAMLGTVDTPDLYLENCPHRLPESHPIKGVFIFYGLYDFTSIDGFPASDVGASLEPFWGAEYSDIPPETLVEMSPMSWVDGTEPPFLLIHGTEDTSVPSWMSEEFAAVLEEAGVDVELLLLEVGHAFELQPLTDAANVQSLAAIEAFLTRISDQ